MPERNWDEKHIEQKNIFKLWEEAFTSLFFLYRRAFYLLNPNQNLNL